MLKTPTHNLVHFDAVEPGCHYNGNVEYWFCTDCEGFWTDEACTVMSNSKNVVVPALGGDVEHVEESCYNVEHWFCAECEQYWLDEALTLITNAKSVLKTPTHNLVHFDAVEPGCHYNGNVEYWFCTDCEGFWTDEACTVMSNSKNVVVPALGGDVEHVEESCYNVEHWFCAECEQYWLDEALTLITNAKSVLITPAHTLQHFAAVEPTATENGNVEYWYCEACDTYFLDEACTLITNAKSVIVPATGASLNDTARLFYFINGLLELTEDELVGMDVNNDGAINLFDAARLFYFINGIIDEL